jgi:hypothetical protein
MNPAAPNQDRAATPGIVCAALIARLYDGAEAGGMPG